MPLGPSNPLRPFVPERIQRGLIFLALAVAAFGLIAACAPEEEPFDPIDPTPTPVEPAPGEPTPIDPIEPTPVDPTPVDPTPVDPTPADPTPVDPAPDDGAVVELGEDPQLGAFLVDDEGMTLYHFANDEPNVSNCTGGCLAQWPPLETVGEPAAGQGVDEALLGTIERDDGSTQVTYNGWPLYYYAGDIAPGDTAGQGLNDLWYVVSPEGEPIEEDVQAAPGL